VTRIVLVSTLLTLAVGCGARVLTLDVGTCFDDPSSFAEVADVPIVRCADPHDNEVIGLFDLPDGEYPGDRAVDDAAASGCLDRFEQYVGIAFADSVYDMGWLKPTATSWDVGDRQVICFVYDNSLATITGTVRGTAT
jgi:hypothetical protein